MNNQRGYLIFEDVRRDSSLKPIFDICVSSVLNKSARIVKTRAVTGYPSYDCFRVEGKEILAGAALEYYLSELGGSDFNYEKAREFSEAMRRLWGWKWNVDRILRQWAERVIRDPFFSGTKDENGYLRWELKPGEPSWRLPDAYLRFGCYIAVNFMKFGASYDQLTANKIFGFITALGSDLPARLKKEGSGDLPKDAAEYKDDTVSCKANDVFAAIKIALKEETEDAYRKALSFLCRLFELDFPRSYAIDFRSPEKSFLPIKGLPKKGVHSLFAGAVRYPALYELIERYARLTIKEFEWYINLEDEHCAMPGTFAVFALGLLGESYHALVCDYLEICDGEHQGIQGNFVLAYIEKFGFTEKGLELYDLLDNNIQWMPKKLTALRAKANRID
jgi:hypothetical protein